MKINELHNLSPGKPAAVTEAAEQPASGRGRIYDAISRNIDMISAEEKKDIISLLQATGGAAKSKRQSRQQPTQPAATPAASQSPEQKFAARRAAAAATARANMTPYSPINTGGAVWRNNRKPDQSGRTKPGDIKESQGTCPRCGGPAFTDLVLAEKKDACYNKVRSRYKVWPSAYASGALVQCRKKGAANWGNKS